MKWYCKWSSSLVDQLVQLFFCSFKTDEKKKFHKMLFIIHHVKGIQHFFLFSNIWIELLCFSETEEPEKKNLGNRKDENVMIMMILMVIICWYWVNSVFRLTNNLSGYSLLMNIKNMVTIMLIKSVIIDWIVQHLISYEAAFDLSLFTQMCNWIQYCD